LLHVWLTNWQKALTLTKCIFLKGGNKNISNRLLIPAWLQILNKTSLLESYFQNAMEEGFFKNSF